MFLDEIPFEDCEETHNGLVVDIVGRYAGNVKDAKCAVLSKHDTMEFTRLWMALDNGEDHFVDINARVPDIYKSKTVVLKEIYRIENGVATYTQELSSKGLETIVASIVFVPPKKK